MFSLFFAAATAIAALFSPLSQAQAPPSSPSTTPSYTSDPSTPSYSSNPSSGPGASEPPNGSGAGAPSNGSGEGEPTAGTGTGAACTTVPGYSQGGLPGHEDSNGFCVPD
jgi:hypothetical protein